MDQLSWIEFLIRSFAGVFVILDPIGASSHFLALTSFHSAKQKKRIAFRSTTTALVVLILFMISGSALFRYFGITLAALKIAGGILLFTVALSMLNGKRPGSKTTPEEEQDAKKQDDVAIIPLAIPLLSGPGAITTVMVLSGEAHDFLKAGILLGAIVVSVFIAYIVFLYSEHIKNVLRPTGIKILTRIMGLIMSVISVQFVINGIYDVIPHLLERLS